MGELVEIVDSLELKVNRLLGKIEDLQLLNRNLSKEVEALKEQKLESDQSINEWEEKFNSLKLANSMLGSNTNKTEAKLKINAMIREIDHCIAQLAE
ncbi:hypothetical protein [Croceivirga thetidis]|uniref:Cell division protein ZapB n=1 Tax=Croceivirga thetidis TaxID=2721623 RepID=A0ABX1GSD4_9FLAO|nr:hypothetical protein [Croceivirga thetidis]NKI32857.1 hypothetical protein [Croceivirga thetidis]